jgi:hypothetical protein
MMIQRRINNDYRTPDNGFDVLGRQKRRTTLENMGERTGRNLWPNSGARETSSEVKAKAETDGGRDNFQSLQEPPLFLYISCL